MKTQLIRYIGIILLAMMCMSIYAQTTTTFTYTATAKIDRFEDEDFTKYFVGATAIVSHDFNEGTGEGTVVYEGTVTALGSNALLFNSKVLILLHVSS